jgi:hypothetical protein
MASLAETPDACGAAFGGGTAKHHHLNKVDDVIVAEIRRSRFLVADFTCEPGKVRGGVYFEAGFARGLNIPIIWTCRDTSPRAQ